jgi:hypothetical protein
MILPTKAQGSRFSLASLQGYSGGCWNSEEVVFRRRREVRTRIKVGVPVSVQYSTKGSDRIISRVEIDDYQRIREQSSAQPCFE